MGNGGCKAYMLVLVKKRAQDCRVLTMHAADVGIIVNKLITLVNSYTLGVVITGIHVSDDPGHVHDMHQYTGGNMACLSVRQVKRFLNLTGLPGNHPGRKVSDYFLGLI